MGGVARRAWARNEASIETVVEYNRAFSESDHITLPFIPDEDLVRGLVKEAFDGLKRS
jgi:urocanate hydratase